MQSAEMVLRFSTYKVRKEPEHSLSLLPWLWIQEALRSIDTDLDRIRFQIEFGGIRKSATCVWYCTVFFFFSYTVSGPQYTLYGMPFRMKMCTYWDTAKYVTSLTVSLSVIPISLDSLSLTLISPILSLLTPLPLVPPPHNPTTFLFLLLQFTYPSSPLSPIQWVWHPSELNVPYKFLHFYRHPFKKIVSGYR